MISDYIVYQVVSDLCCLVLYLVFLYFFILKIINLLNKLHNKKKQN